MKPKYCMNGERVEELSECDDGGERTAIIVWQDEHGPTATTARFNKYGGCISHLMGWRLKPEDTAQPNVIAINPFCDEPTDMEPLLGCEPDADRPLISRAEAIEQYEEHPALKKHLSRDKFLAMIDENPELFGIRPKGFLK